MLFTKCVFVLCQKGISTLKYPDCIGILQQKQDSEIPPEKISSSSKQLLFSFYTHMIYVVEVQTVWGKLLSTSHPELKASILQLLFYTCRKLNCAMTVERRDEDGITMITDLTSDDWKQLRLGRNLEIHLLW